MSAIYEENKDEDGFLYMTYSGENTFGSFWVLSRYELYVNKAFKTQIEIMYILCCQLLLVHPNFEGCS